MSDKLTKAEIVESLSEQLGMNKKDIHLVVNSLFDIMKTAIYDDRVVELRGFGTFEVRTRKGRQGARNPKTGQSVDIASHGAVIFRPGKELKSIARGLRG